MGIANTNQSVTDLEAFIANDVIDDDISDISPMMMTAQ
jgi:hypothetical protein